MNNVQETIYKFIWQGVYLAITLVSLCITTIAFGFIIKILVKAFKIGWNVF